MPSPLLTPTAIVDAMVTVLNSIDGIGIIHRQRKQLRTEPIAQKILLDPNQGRICAWMISPSPSGTALSERNPGHFGAGVKGGGNVLTTFGFQIEGFYGLSEDQGSEENFRDLAWAVANEFNSYGLIGVQPMGALAYQGPANLVQFGYALVANTFFTHYARVTLAFQGRTRI